MHILITGCNGFIGRNLVNHFKTNHSVDAASRKEFDMLDSESVKKFFEDKKYDLVIHTAIEGGRRTKPDTEEMVYKNILMVYNLLENQDKFDNMITFGSGAELDRRFDINEKTNVDRRYPTDFYGISKSIIHKLCMIEPKLYNFRIFNCFGSDESETRFIRGNIEKNIKGESMILFSNRLMDFFYMDDLISMINQFTINPSVFPKSIDCVYENKYRLSDILNIINEVSDNSVDIIKLNDESINSINTNQTDYIGKFTDLSIEFIGLRNSIEIVYNKIKEKL
jgi:UDP-glucose 4-epimerase